MNLTGYRQDLQDNPDTSEYYGIVKDLLEHEKVQEMNKYPHHYAMTCLSHSISVSYYCYVLCKKWKLDYVSAARAGLLHDLFLYDWREHKLETGEALHGFRHPVVAYQNAKKYFDINKIEKDMILNHMWPLTFYRRPRHMESFVIIMVDKYCGTLELANHFIPVFKLASD